MVAIAIVTVVVAAESVGVSLAVRPDRAHLGRDVVGQGQAQATGQAAVLVAVGLGPGRDTLPLDEGITTALPDAKIR